MEKRQWWCTLIGVMGLSVCLFGTLTVEGKKKDITINPAKILQIEGDKNQLIKEEKINFRLRKVENLIKIGSIDALETADILLLGLQKEDLEIQIDHLIENQKTIEKAKKEEVEKKQIEEAKKTEEKHQIELEEERKKQEAIKEQLVKEEAAEKEKILKEEECKVQEEEEKEIQAQEEYFSSSIAVENQMIETPASPMYQNLVNIAGISIPIINVQGATTAPEGNVVGYWMGDGNTNDGAMSYIIGHNPGPFSCLFNVGIGSPITLWDNSGNQRTYYVQVIKEVDDAAYGRDGEDCWDIMSNPGGESLVLQTCIDDNWNRIVIAY